MTEEHQAKTTVLPREDGRVRRLGLEVQGGRDGWGSELSPLYMSEIPTGNFVTGGTGTRELQVDEVENTEDGEHRFVGERPHEIIMLEPRFDHLSDVTTKPTIRQLQNADEALKLRRVPEILAELAAIGNK